MHSRMDGLISTGAGQVKAVRARLGGLLGVFTTLAKQHGEVAALMRRLRNDPDKCDDLWPEIRRELLSHERAELAVVYPALRECGEIALVERHEREASQMEQLVARLEELDDDQVFMASFGDLVDAVLHHADEEEKEIFPRAEKALGKQRAAALDQAFLGAKEKILRAIADADGGTR